jgi:hypothetical protein
LRLFSRFGVSLIKRPVNCKPLTANDAISYRLAGAQNIVIYCRFQKFSQ